MKPEWKSFLEHKGAEFDDGTVVSFGNAERERRVVTAGEVIADLSHSGLISASGAGAQEFLQGQLTNDIRQVSASHSQLSGFCSPKGRILANFMVFQRGDAYYLRMPREQVEPTLKRLRMFVLRAQVTLEDASDNWVHIGYSGPDAAKQLHSLFGAAPEKPHDVLQSDALTIVRLHGPHPRFEIYGELDGMQKLWTLLDVRAAPVGEEAWRLLDIRAGVPVVYAATADAFVPQMVNMQLVDGLSFTKGCYPGQEVVARMQYLGKLKRRMYRARIDGKECPAPGTTLFAAGSTSGQGAGKVVCGARSPDGGCELLAVVEIASQEAGDIHLDGLNGPVLHFEPLPYAFVPAGPQDQA